MPVRCASRSSSDRRNAGPPERPSTTAHASAAVGRGHHLDRHLPPALGQPVVLARQQPRARAAASTAASRPSKAGAASEAAATSQRAGPRDASTTAQPLWNTRGSSAASSLAAVPSAAAGQRLQQLQLAVGVQRPGEGPERLHRSRPAPPAAAVIRLSGSRSRRQLDDDVVDGDAAAALEDVERTRCRRRRRRARWRPRRGCRAGRAPPGAGDRTRFLRVVLEVRADLRRSRWVQPLTPVPRRTARERPHVEWPGHVAGSRTSRRAPPKWSSAPA